MTVFERPMDLVDEVYPVGCNDPPTSPPGRAGPTWPRSSTWHPARWWLGAGRPHDDRTGGVSGWSPVSDLCRFNHVHGHRTDNARQSAQKLCPLSVVKGRTQHQDSKGHEEGTRASEPSDEERSWSFQPKSGQSNDRAHDQLPYLNPPDVTLGQRLTNAYKVAAIPSPGSPIHLNMSQPRVGGAASPASTSASFCLKR